MPAGIDCERPHQRREAQRFQDAYRIRAGPKEGLGKREDEEDAGRLEVPYVAIWNLTVEQSVRDDRIDALITAVFEGDEVAEQVGGADERDAGDDSIQRRPVSCRMLSGPASFAVE